MNNQQQQQYQVNPVLAQLEDATKKYNGARSTLIGVVIFSAINVVLAAIGNGTYFLFSALVPLFFTYINLLPVAIVCIAGYFLFWLLSKKRVGWLVAALVFFIIDSIAMFVLFEIDASMILDVIFHIIVLVSLIGGVASHGKMKKLSVQYAQQQAMAQQFAAQQAAAQAAQLQQEQPVAQIEQPVAEQIQQPVADDAQNGTL